MYIYVVYMGIVEEIGFELNKAEPIVWVSEWEWDTFVDSYSVFKWLCTRSSPRELGSFSYRRIDFLRLRVHPIQRKWSIQLEVHRKLHQSHRNSRNPCILESSWHGSGSKSKRSQAQLSSTVQAQFHFQLCNRKSCNSICFCIAAIPTTLRFVWNHCSSFLRATHSSLSIISKRLPRTIQSTRWVITQPNLFSFLKF